MKKQLKQTLEKIYKKYHHPKFLGLDPLICVRRFEDNENREVAGLLSAGLAYGRVEIIVRNIETLLSLMQRSPVDFIMDTDYQEKRKLFADFKHRFNDGQDIAALLESIKNIISEYGSLEKCFCQCMDKNENQFKDALTSFTNIIKDKGRAFCGDRQSFEYLIPSPDRGSACKRVVMYMRWMIREDDGIDLGVWKDISAANLIMPVDTHVAKIAQTLRFTERKTADWRMAAEITDALKEFDPCDPVRYDFSLCRAGMVDFRGKHGQTFSDYPYKPPVSCDTSHKLRRSEV
ncbi:MAG: TIGR02757 family protein [Chitinispirillia bacterium]|nr:TIGR02757 family protein [Chitinispirillia bacterium]